MRTLDVVRLLKQIGKDELAENDEQQLAVLVEALGEYLEKNKKYFDLWMDGGMPDSLHHIRSKSARVLSDNVAPHEKVEDAIDLINYCVFLIRNIRAGRLTPQDMVVDSQMRRVPLKDARFS